MDIKNVASKIRSNCPERLLIEPHFKRQRDFQNNQNVDNISSTHLATMLNILGGNQLSNRTFEEALESLKQNIGLHYNK
ncbi:hypothetical protein [Neobacillus cucumis]|uniref:hypothetical protein n=1 Tax=Neobacillus cucumis TaxID=1740721 RepID=UPI0015E0C3C8|nr:hypothetical protein [Neobacillus cucumis]